MLGVTLALSPVGVLTQVSHLPCECAYRYITGCTTAWTLLKFKPWIGGPHIGSIDSILAELAHYLHISEQGCDCDNVIAWVWVIWPVKADFWWAFQSFIWAKGICKSLDNVKSFEFDNSFDGFPNLICRHFVKGIRKRIYEASKLKGCDILLLWQSSIINTIWFALATCQGMLIEAKELTSVACSFAYHKPYVLTNLNFTL